MTPPSQCLRSSMQNIGASMGLTIGLLRPVNARISRIGRKQQLCPCTPLPRMLKTRSCVGGLMYFMNARADAGLQLVYDRTGNNSV